MKETIYKIQRAPYLALVSDLHGKSCKNVIMSLRNHKPDMICITGDIIFGIRQEDDVSPLISQSHILLFLTTFRPADLCGKAVRYVPLYQSL